METPSLPSAIYARAAQSRQDRDLLALMNELRPSEDDIPHVRGVRMYGATLGLESHGGADHLTYINPHHPSRGDLNGLIALAQRQSADALRAGHEYEALLHAERAEQLKAYSELGYALVIDSRGHDLAGKFLSASVHQMFILAAQYELAQHGRIRAEILMHINDRVNSTSEFPDGSQKDGQTKRMYATAILAEFHPGGGVEWISVGHPRPAIHDIASRKTGLLGSQNAYSMPLGMGSFTRRDGGRIAAVPYTVQKASIGEGEVFMLYSDGLVEGVKGRNGAQLVEGEYFATYVPRMLRRHPKDPRAAVEAIMHDLEHRCERNDDITLLAAVRE